MSNKIQRIYDLFANWDANHITLGELDDGIKEVIDSAKREELEHMKQHHSIGYVDSDIHYEVILVECIDERITKLKQLGSEK